MRFLCIASLGLAGISLTQAAIDDGYSTDGTNQMGPAAFMWPKDRVWSAAADNTEPCGSVASPQNRSQFPLTNGHVALVDQYEGFNLQLSVSYLSNPSDNSDFDVLISTSRVKELDEGHTCLSVPNAPSSVASGHNATLQIKYTSAGNDNKNETYYACADIVYVDLSDFNYQVPCFNATESSDSSSGGGKPSTSATSSPSSSPSSNGSKHSGSGGHKLSGGDIAGIVVGTVVGVIALAGVGAMIYRRRFQRRKDVRETWPAYGGKDVANTYPMKPTGGANSLSNASISK